MIRSFRLSDLPRQLLPGRLATNDLVCTRVSLPWPRHRLSQLELARWAILASRHQKVLTAIDNGRVEGIALVQARHKPSASEVAHLFASARGYAQLDALMLGCVRSAAQSGADRLFLRSPAGGPAAGPAVRLGFQRAFAEELFGGLMPQPRSTDLTLSPLNSADLHGVFRLHAAALPAPARPAIGLTLDQWIAAREEVGGRKEEFVCATGNSTLAWLSINRLSHVTIVEAILHPDHPTLADSLVDETARIISQTLPVRWIVPSHEPALSRALQARGWNSHGTYDVFVRTLAQRAQEPTLVPAQA